jgi:hypothetical protein
MQYVVTQTKQIGIDADTPEDAIKQVLGGAGDILSVNIGASQRPQPQSAGGRPTVMVQPGR